jgi:Cellulose binding domain./Fibronectin type III domain.
VVRASDGRNVSDFSAPVTFRTDPAPRESEPPSPPGAPVVTAVTARTVGLSWTPSTDNASTPTYLVYARAEGVGVATVVGGGADAATEVGMLIPDLTYDFHVVARDLSGNVSSPSPSTRQRTGSDPDGSCSAGYRPAGGGSPAALQVTNTGPAGLQAWSIRFRLPDGQRVEHAGYAWAQHGQDVVLWWSGWGDQFSVGETLNASLYLGGGTPDAVPTDVTLNGVACTAI